MKKILSFLTILFIILSINLIVYSFQADPMVIAKNWVSKIRLDILKRLDHILEKTYKDISWDSIDSQLSTYKALISKIKELQKKYTIWEKKEILNYLYKKLNIKLELTISKNNLSWKCGDNICDAKEKSNPKLCLRDCTQNTDKETGSVINYTPDSNFSFGYLIGRDLGKYATDLGVEWVRLEVMWKRIQPTSGSEYNWEATEKLWEFTQYPKSTNFLITLSQIGVNSHAGEEKFQKGKFSYIPNETGEYNRQDWINLVKAVVEHYDGDGIGDSPNLSQPIKYYEVENESGLHSEMKDYAKLFEMTHDAIKEVCADCRVVMSGNVSGMTKDLEADKLKVDQMDSILKELSNDNRQDILTDYDFHWNKELKGYDPYEIVQYLKSKLSDLKFDTNKITFWITEGGTYSGAPTIPKNMPIQSEVDQATGVVKYFVSAFGSGVNKYFWAYGIKEGFKYSCNLFDYTGLVYDGDITPPAAPVKIPGLGDYSHCNNTYDLGDNNKKLAYYSYKKIVEILGGTNSVQTIQRTDDGIHIYKFAKSSKNIWVVWNDSSISKTINLSSIASSQVKITEAVPRYKLGKDITDYATTFNEEIKSVQGGVLTIILKDVPVFVEEI